MPLVRFDGDDVIEAAALAWFEAGGDSEGITWCWQAIRDRVKEMEDNK